MSDPAPPASNEPESATPAAEPPSPPLRDEDFEPVGRDARFIYRMLAAMVLGLAVAAWVGSRARNAAGACGAGLLRPGTSVIPPQGSAP